MDLRAQNTLGLYSFLEANGWVRDAEEDYYITFIKTNNISFDIDDDEIVVIGEIGDIAHFPIDSNILYTLLGYLIQHHYLAVDYTWIK